MIGPLPARIQLLPASMSPRPAHRTPLPSGRPRAHPPARRLVDAANGIDVPLCAPYLQHLILSGAAHADTPIRDESGTELPLARSTAPLPFEALRRRVVRLHAMRRDAEAVEWIALFRQFDATDRQPDLPNLDFIEALVLAANNPKRSEELYLNLLGRSGHHLVPVANNNVAVLYCRQNRWDEALPHLLAAFARTEPFLVAAALNLRVAVKHLLEKPARGRSPAGQADREKLRQHLTAAEARIEEIKGESALLRQLTRRHAMPFDEFAELLVAEELGAAAGLPGETDASRLRAEQSLGAAAASLEHRDWEWMELWLKVAENDQADDPAVLGAVARLRALGRMRRQTLALAAQRKDWLDALDGIAELERAGRTDLAKSAAISFAAELRRLDPAELPVGLIADVSSYIDRLDATLARRQFEAGRAARTADPSQAVAHWQVASAHPSQQQAGITEIAALNFEALDRELEAALAASDFDRAYLLAGKMRGEALTPELHAQLAHREEAVRLRHAAHEFARAQQACGAGDFSTAAAAAAAAALHHPGFAECGTAIETTERNDAARRALQPICDLLGAKKFTEAYEALLQVAVALQATAAARTLRDDVVQARQRDITATADGHIELAQFKAQWGSFDGAEEALRAAAETDAYNLGLPRHKLVLDLQRLLDSARRAGAQGEYAKAVQIILPATGKLRSGRVLLGEFVLHEMRFRSNDLVAPISATVEEEVRTACELLGRNSGSASDHFAALAEQHLEVETLRAVVEQLDARAIGTLRAIQEDVASGTLEEARQKLRALLATNLSARCRRRAANLEREIAEIEKRKATPPPAPPPASWFTRWSQRLFKPKP